MNQEEIYDLVHNLRSNEDCSDEQLCEVIKAANQTNTIENLNTLFKQSEKKNSSKSRAVKFTQKEINQIPKKFKKQFIYNKITAHVRITPRGVYEVRCTIDGIHYLGSSKDLDTAKAKFISDLRSDKQAKVKKAQEAAPTEEEKLLFTDYFMKWLNTAKKQYIKDNSYQSYITVYNANIKNQFVGLTFDDINIFFLQEYMNGFINSEKFRTAKKVYNLLSPCFDYAVADEIINRNPMAKIVIPSTSRNTVKPFPARKKA